MSYNVRVYEITDGPDFWDYRKDRVAEVIKEYLPCLAGLQEVFTVQAMDLEERLPGYAWFGPGREDGKGVGERCPLFFREDRLERIEDSAFWLSETPGLPGSRSWGTAFPRVVTWARFRHKEEGKEFYLFNTHFDHMSAEARKNSAALLLDKAIAIAEHKPAVVTVDLNTGEQSGPYRVLASGLRDAGKIAGAKGPRNTFWTFVPGVAPLARIDYIFVNDLVRVVEFRAIEDAYDNDRRPSDHLPLLAEVELL